MSKERIDLMNSNTADHIIKTAIESGAIKLTGSASNLMSATTNAKSDAMYLLTLMHHLTKESPQP